MHQHPPQIAKGAAGDTAGKQSTQVNTTGRTTAAALEAWCDACAGVTGTGMSPSTSSPAWEVKSRYTSIEGSAGAVGAQVHQQNGGVPRKSNSRFVLTGALPTRDHDINLLTNNRNGCTSWRTPAAADSDTGGEKNKSQLQKKKHW